MFLGTRKKPRFSAGKRRLGQCFHRRLKLHQAKQKYSRNLNSPERLENEEDSSADEEISLPQRDSLDVVLFLQISGGDLGS